MPSDDIVISARGLGKTYRLFAHPGERVKQFLSFGLRQYHKNFAALQDVSFEIRSGETIGIIGRNGSGKSTLLQLICQILKPTSGKITINGRVSALLELGAGFNPEFSGRENVYFQGSLMGIPRTLMEKRFDEIAAFADIGEFIDQPVRIYSSGMFVRLAFAVAIHVDPDILVIDEALAVGDAAFQAKCIEKIQEMQSEGLTIILVAHASPIVAGLCSRVMHLEAGKLVRFGKPSDVLAGYEESLVQAEQQSPTHRNLQSPGLVLCSVRTIDAGGRNSILFQQHALLVVEVTLASDRLVRDPCIGLEIRGANGFPIWSTTTANLGVSLTPVVPNHLTRIRWKFTADMAPGIYSLAIGAGELLRGNYHRHDRLHHAAEITVLGPFKAHGYLPLRPIIEAEDSTP